MLGGFFSIIANFVGVGAYDDPCKQPPTEPNRSVDDNGESLHQSLLQREKVAAKPTDEVFLTANQPQSICRKSCNERGGRFLNRPYGVKDKIDENP